jgi:SOS-response transcriptional repressor LexA
MIDITKEKDMDTNVINLLAKTFSKDVKDKETERKILRTISGYINLNGISPSIREISKECFLSVERTWRYIVKLETDGYITHKKHTARSIKIIRH